MSFSIVTDTSANLPRRLIEQHQLTVIPFSYFVDQQEHTCIAPEDYDGQAYFTSLAKGLQVTTSLVPPQRYIDRLEPLLAQGQDILLVSMSSGISGSFDSAQSAAAQLRQKYPARSIRLVDSMGASLGEGLLALAAVEDRAAGKSLEETAVHLLTMRDRMCQIFMVDDLANLRRTGRISGVVAVLGSVLHIKPLLKGNEHGKIVMWSKVRGRKAAINCLVQRYRELVRNPQEQCVGIAYAGCPEDAALLAQQLRAEQPPRDILTVCYEPVTGSHVGCGTLALFFLGPDGARTLI